MSPLSRILSDPRLKPLLRYTGLVLAVTALRSLVLVHYDTWQIDEERVVLIAMGFIDFDLNPRWFNYHPLAMYVLGAVYFIQYLGYRLFGLVDSKAEFASLLYSADAHLYVPAKLVFSLAYTVGCLLLALMVIRRTGSRAGAVLVFVAAIFTSDAILAANQIKIDTFVFLFLAATIYFACFAEKRLASVLLASVFCAAAFATKVPAIVLLPVLLTQLGYDAFKGRYPWRYVAVSAALFPVFVLLFMPYAVLEFDAWKATFERTFLRASGSFHHVGKALHTGFFDKWANLLGELAKQGGIFALMGCAVFAGYTALRARSMLFVFLFAAAYAVAFSTSANLDSYWLRPAYPFLLLLPVLLVLLLADLPQVRDRLYPVAARIRPGIDPARGARAVVLAAVAVLYTTALAGNAPKFFEGFHPLPEDSRVAAARWIETHFPAGTLVVLEGHLPHYQPALYTPNWATQLAIFNYAYPHVAENRLLMAGLKHYLDEAKTTRKPFRVVLMDQNMNTGYDMTRMRIPAGSYVVISSVVYNRFYRENVMRQSPQLARNAQAFYALIRAQEPVKQFSGRGPKIDIFRMRKGLNMPAGAAAPTG